MFYLSRKARIIKVVKETWPTDQPVPKFRSNEANTQKLHELAEKLARDEEYSMPDAGLKYNAISELIRKHMMERRRRDSDALLSSMEESDRGSTSSASRMFENILQKKRSQSIAQSITFLGISI